MTLTLKHYLRVNEGSRLLPYVDTGGQTTIGVGRNLSVNGISHDEEELMLDNDIARAESAVMTLCVAANLTSGTPRHIALCDMAFNLGRNGLAGFRRMLSAVNAHDWEKAAREALRSDWALQVGTRAYRDAFVIQHDRFPNPRELADFASANPSGRRR